MSDQPCCFNLVLAATGLAWAATGATAQQSRGNVPPADDPVYDRIVEDFIQFDIGNVRDPFVAERIKARFHGLKAEEAVPALVRGLNKSTRMRASCPITAIIGKMRSLLASSKNPAVGTHVLQNLDIHNAGAYRAHVNALSELAEKQVERTMVNGLAEQQFGRRTEELQQRMAYVPGMKLTELAARDPAASQASGEDRSDDNAAERPRSNGARSPVRKQPSQAGTADLSRLSVAELAERLKEGTSAGKLLTELYRRASQDDEEVAEAADAILHCLKQEDDAARETAVRLIGMIRYRAAVPQLIDALEDSDAQVRSSAATALTRITRQLFGPRDNATPAERQKAVARWRDWWTRHGKVAER